MEGHDRMTGALPVTLTVTWHIAPLSSPQPHRHCPGCGTSRPFRSSGKVRLNANGRRLDAWLIYKCTTCDRTWNLPLLDRIAVSAIDPGHLWAMQVSDPTWVRSRAFDLALLRRHADRINLPTDLMVTKDHPARADWHEIRLDLHAPLPTGQRLDRFLAGELGLSRSRLMAMVGSGGLSLMPGSRHALKALVSGQMRLSFLADRMGTGDKVHLSRALLDPPA
jgi:hypothetical protein